MKERLDTLLVQRGMVESKELAQRLILAGEVRVEGHPATKAGHKYDTEIAIELLAQPRFVSRGGEKLQGAFDAFGLNVEGLIGLDVGSSTGGFTDCLLQHGARHVIAVDVGKGQLHWKLRTDPRVTVMEEFNARYLQPEDLPMQPEVGVTDVSFISLKLILPPMVQALKPGAHLISLIKPQFEAGRDKVPGGVVRDPAVHEAVCNEIHRFATEELRLTCHGIVPSPLKGPEGNIEFLAHWQTPMNY